MTSGGTTASPIPRPENGDVNNDGSVNQADIDYLAEKTLNMRLFPPEGSEGEDGGFDRSALEVRADILLDSSSGFSNSTDAMRIVHHDDDVRPLVEHAAHLAKLVDGGDDHLAYVA